MMLSSICINHLHNRGIFSRKKNKSRNFLLIRALQNCALKKKTGNYFTVCDSIDSTNRNITAPLLERFGRYKTVLWFSSKLRNHKIYPSLCWRRGDQRHAHLLGWLKQKKTGTWAEQKHWPTSFNSTNVHAWIVNIHRKGWDDLLLI